FYNWDGSSWGRPLMLTHQGLVFPDGTMQSTAFTGTSISQWYIGDNGTLTYKGGNVGIGIANTTAKLDVRGSTFLGSSDPNRMIKFSDGWSGYPDNTLGSEISNDTNGFKTLMIVGNKSA